MATYNYKIKSKEGNTTDVLHPETNTGQVYDYENAKWLSEVIGVLSSLSTNQKTSLVSAINEIASKAITLNNTLTSNSTTQAVTAAQAKILNDKTTTHESKVATTTQLGHVKPDGVTVIVNSEGVLSANTSSEGGGENIDAHLSDYMPHDSGLSQYSSSVDTNGFYRIVEYKRADNTLHLKSTASNPNASGRYQTITWQFYATNGTTLALTKTWTITYDANGVIVSKVLS